jgi:ATP-dependent Clp protease ATP-binding subunit ClpC
LIDAMYEKFSPRVDKVIKLANEIAREYDQEYVGTEHVLLAILREGTGIGAKILLNHGITEAGLREEIDKLIKKSMEETWVFGRLPGTPHFKNVVATAIEQARQIESKEICTEHLLLALSRESGSVAYRALKNVGIRYADIKSDVLDFAPGAS